MARTGLWAVLLVLTASTPLHAQKSEALNDIKAKVWEAQLVQRNFAAGLRHCNELNGTNFYFQMRDRVLNLEEYQRSLESLVKAKARNPAKQGPWTHEDAKERSEEVKRQAQEDKRKCELVQSLPKLEERLQELQAVAEKKQ